MHYDQIRQGRFLARPNRFLAQVTLEEGTVICHVKNTGRCRELLYPGVPVWVQLAPSPTRKTRWDLVAVQKGERIVNIDSQAPNRVAAHWLKAGGLGFVPTLLRPETRHGNSRFDFYLEAPGRRMFVEVKGVTLEEAGTAYFPDAPTLRGLKHLRELEDCVRQGFEACALFVVQLEGIRAFRPNMATQPEFGEALRRAAALGVRLEARSCRVSPDTLEIADPVPVELPPFEDETWKEGLK